MSHTGQVSHVSHMVWKVQGSGHSYSLSRSQIRSLVGELRSYKLAVLSSSSKGPGAEGTVSAGPPPPLPVPWCAHLMLFLQDLGLYTLPSTPQGCSLILPSWNVLFSTDGLSKSA